MIVLSNCDKQPFAAAVGTEAFPSATASSVIFLTQSSYSGPASTNVKTLVPVMRTTRRQTRADEEHMALVAEDLPCVRYTLNGEFGLRRGVRILQRQLDS